MIIPSGLAVSRINATDELLVAPEVRATGLALSGLVVVAGTIGLTLELTIIILRFLNIGYVNLKINYLLSTVSTCTDFNLHLIPHCAFNYDVIMIVIFL